MPVSGDASSTTKSAVATGTIEVRSNPNQDLSTLSRDTTGALNALDKIFDKKTVQEKQELANLFGEVAFNAIGDLALSQYEKALKNRDNATTAEEKAYYQNQMNQWNEGGSNKILLHALAGGIMSDLAGNGFASGVVSAGVNEAIQKELSNIKDPGLHQLASALIGGVAAKIVGSNASVGASVAASATKNNCLNHRQQMELADKLSKATSTEEREKILNDYQWLSEYQIGTGIDPDTGMKFEVDPNTGKPYEVIEPELANALNNIPLSGTLGTVNYNVSSGGGLNYNLATAKDYLHYANETLDLGKNVGESLVDAKVGEKIINQLRPSFTIGKISASSLGPATTLEIAVNTTPGSTIVLKGVSKVLGGVVALGQTSYDVYVDYKTFGGFNEKFAMAASADIGTTVVLAIGGGAAVSLGAPVMAVAIGGGYVAYLVSSEIINPWKETLK